MKVQPQHMPFSPIKESRQKISDEVESDLVKKSTCQSIRSSTITRDIPKDAQQSKGGYQKWQDDFKRKWNDRKGYPEMLNEF